MYFPKILNNDETYLQNLRISSELQGGNCSPILVNCALKTPEIRLQLYTDDFWNFCLREFRSRSLLRRLLYFATPPRERWDLRYKPRKSMLENLYLCSPSAKYRDLKAELDTSRFVTNALTKIMPPKAPALIGSQTWVVPLTSTPQYYFQTGAKT